MIKDIIPQLYNERIKVNEWLHDHGLKNSEDIFYSSVDIRHSNDKVTVVDMNLFPGGFNNLAEEFYVFAVSAIEKYLTDIDFDKNKLILLIPENHTRNQFYIQNILTIEKLLLMSGCNVILGSLDHDLVYEETTTSNTTITIKSISKLNNKIITHSGQTPDLIMLNNDLSAGLPNILEQIEQPIIPSILSGWYRRLKHQFFTQYNKISRQFATDFNLDVWRITTDFTVCKEVKFDDYESLVHLQTQITDMFSLVSASYNQRNIKTNPFLIAKADNGTYGMGIMSIEQGFDFTKINRKDKNKMSIIKDGSKVTSLLIQEGVESIIYTPENHVAEPVIYSVGSTVIGGFYRVNNVKGIHDNLNANGMYFNKMNVQEMATPMFYCYSLLAKLSIIAAQNELISY